jgi:hypothetical protein
MLAGPHDSCAAAGEAGGRPGLGRQDRGLLKTGGSGCEDLVAPYCARAG